MVLSLRDITETHINPLLLSPPLPTPPTFTFPSLETSKQKIYFPGLVEAER